MNYPKLIAMILFLTIIPTGHSIEYNKNSGPLFTLNNEVLINNIQFCFKDHSNYTYCRPIYDFNDENKGITCDYYWISIFKNNIHLGYNCEIKKQMSEICPIVLDLDTWPSHIITDELEENLKTTKINNSIFGLSSDNKSLVFKADINKDHDTKIISSKDSIRLYICSKSSKIGNYSTTIDMVASTKKINNETLHDPISIIENPPIYSFGPEETASEGEIITIDFFKGRVNEWHPELPYADLAFEISPKNKTYNKNEILLIEFKGTGGTYEEEIPYNNKSRMWIFPVSGTKQIKFEHDSWLFPFSQYTTTINITNNISLNNSQELEIHNSKFLEGTVDFSKNEIKVEIYYNQTSLWIIIILIFISSSTLLYSFKILYNNTKIPSSTYFIPVVPIIPLYYVNILPIESIISITLFSGNFLFWSYFLLKKYKISRTEKTRRKIDKNNKKQRVFKAKKNINTNTKSMNNPIKIGRQRHRQERKKKHQKTEKKNTDNH